MKAVILAGGLGTRLSEATNLIPKPMVEIGGKPILWHILKTYSNYGINDFIICCGYKAYIIKEYFANYFLHNSDITVNLIDGSINVHHAPTEQWKVTCIDTGLNTMTGGRIKRIQEYIGDESFLMTYGDGVANLDIDDTITMHKASGKAISVTVYQPTGKFGALIIDTDGNVRSFQEKPTGDGTWINAGYFVCEPTIFDYITLGDDAIFEQDSLENLARDGKMNSYKHRGFWKPMDTLRDNIELNQMWDNNEAPWKIW